MSVGILCAEKRLSLQDEYDPAKWPVTELKLPQAASLIDIYDSGLRPYRFPGLESTTLEVKHLRLAMHLSSGKVLPVLPTEWMHIKVFNDGYISQLEGATPPLSVDLAREEMSKWLALGGRSENDLHEFLEAVKKAPLDFDDPYGGYPDGYPIGWKEPEWGSWGGGPHCGLSFRKTFDEARPLRLYFSLSWNSNRPLKEARNYDIPIPPPPGYEHASMEAPKNFGPDSMVDILKSKGVDIGDGKGGISYNEYLASQQAGQDAGQPNSVVSLTSKNERSGILAWLLPLIIMTLAAFFVLLWILWIKRLQHE